MRNLTMRRLALVAGITAGTLALAAVAVAAPGMMARISPAPSGAVAASIDTPAPVNSSRTSTPADLAGTSVSPISVKESASPVGETNATALIPTQIKLQRGTLRFETTTTPVTVRGTLSALETSTTTDKGHVRHVRTPLAGMTVRLLASAGKGGKLVQTQMALTKADGSFSFDIMPARAMRVRVVFDGTDVYKRSHGRVLVLQPAKAAKGKAAKSAHESQGAAHRNGRASSGNDGNDGNKGNKGNSNGHANR